MARGGHNYGKDTYCGNCGMGKPERGAWVPNCWDIMASFDGPVIDEPVSYWPAYLPVINRVSEPS